MTLNERLQEAFDKRVCGTAMLPASELLSAMTAIEQAETDNAALKEQVALLSRRVTKAMQHEIADLKEQITNAKYNYLGAMADCKQYEETITQQAEAIRVKNEALFTAYTTFTEYAQIHSAKQPPDTRKSAFNFDRANQMNAAITIQPSPEILQARDDRVAAACAKVVDPRSLAYVTRGDALAEILSGA